jgi:hypothetical protein
LEERNLLTTASPGVFVLAANSFQPATGLPSGFSPAQIRQAYGFNQITFQNGAVIGDGAGQTIAIVDAYDQPNLANNLAVFDSTYGIAPPPSFIKVNQIGGNTLPPAVASWGLEESLDVEWAHAIAPAAKIVLVEAGSASSTDLLTAVNYARNLPGVSAVSMSFGGGEWSGEAATDSFFTTPAGHNGVTFIASSGDNGSAAAPEWPSVSPNVLAVGGTQLSASGTGAYMGETGWSGSGGGISLFEAQRSYQHGVVTQSAGARTVPDVAYDGSSNSPFAVYDTLSYAGWLEVYGTSCGAPQWSALVAIADQGRVLNGLGTLDGATQLLPIIYGLSSADFHDVTSGSNGYAAGPGYDLVTGRGSPLANLVVPVLAGQTLSPPAVTVTTLGSNVNLSLYGQPVTFTAQVFAGKVGVPSGVVAFMQGGTLLGTGALSGGIAAFTTDSLEPGGNVITAVFAGGSSFAASSSLSSFQIVTAANTTVGLTSSANPSLAGNLVTLTVSVTPVAPGGGTPGGIVYFLTGNTVLAAVPLGAGSASFVTPAFPAGTTGVTAFYVGDGRFLAATSATLPQKVAASTASGGASALHANVAPPYTDPGNSPPTADATVSGTFQTADASRSASRDETDPSARSGMAVALSDAATLGRVTLADVPKNAAPTTVPPPVGAGGRSAERASVSDAVWVGWTRMGRSLPYDSGGGSTYGRGIGVADTSDGSLPDDLADSADVDVPVA